MVEKKEVVTNPDPTEAVKEALTLAIKNLEEKVMLLFRSAGDAVVLARTELGEKLAAMKNALESAAAEKASSNKDLVEKLEKANQIALTAALQTQKESAAKSELSMADLLKQLQVSFETANRATNEKIDRLTSRLDTGEGRVVSDSSNRQTAREDSRDYKRTETDNRAFYVSLIAAAVAAAALFFGLNIHK
jgi:hypothetical protein